MKLSHAASRLRTAIAELTRTIGVGSGALLGVVNCYLRACQKVYKARTHPAAWMVVDQPKANSRTSGLIAALIPHDESHQEYWLSYLQESAAKQSGLRQDVAR